MHRNFAFAGRKVAHESLHKLKQRSRALKHSTPLRRYKNWRRPCRNKGVSTLCQGSDPGKETYLGVQGPCSIVLVPIRVDLPHKTFAIRPVPTTHRVLVEFRIAGGRSVSLDLLPKAEQAEPDRLNKYRNKRFVRLRREHRSLPFQRARGCCRRRGSSV